MNFAGTEYNSCIILVTNLGESLLIYRDYALPLVSILANALQVLDEAPGIVFPPPPVRSSPLPLLAPHSRHQPEAHLRLLLELWLLGGEGVHPDPIARALQQRGIQLELLAHPHPGPEHLDAVLLFPRPLLLVLGHWQLVVDGDDAPVLAQVGVGYA